MFFESPFKIMNKNSNFDLKIWILFILFTQSVFVSGQNWLIPNLLPSDYNRTETPIRNPTGKR